MNILTYHLAKSIHEIVRIVPGRDYVFDAENVLHYERSKKYVNVLWLEQNGQCVASDPIKKGVGFDTKQEWLQPDPGYMQCVYDLIIRDLHEMDGIIQVKYYRSDYVQKELRNQPVIVLGSKITDWRSGHMLIRHLNSKGIINLCDSSWLVGG